jgi:hypothetical protein
MCRLGDQGPYADWNVYAATFRDNCCSARPQLTLSFDGGIR